MQLLGVTVLALLGSSSAFRPARVSSRSQLNMAVNNDDFAALEKKISSKQSTAAQTTAAPAKKAAAPVSSKPAAAAPAKKVAAPVASKPAAVVAKPAAPVVQKSTPAPVVQKAAPTVVKSIEVAPASASSLSSGDFAAGVFLGLAPLVVLPVVLLSAAKGLLGKPKPLPVPEAPKVKVQPYNKALGDGAKEGIDELLSGKVTPDLELTRKGIKLSVAGFSLAFGLLAVNSILGGQVKEEEVKKPVAPAAKVAPAAPKPAAPAAVVAPAEVKKAVEAPKVEAPKPVEAPKAVEAPKVDTAAADKAAADKAAAEKAAAEKAAAEKAAAEKAAAEKAAAAKAAAEKAAAEKAAAVKAPEAKPVEVEYKAAVPKGMEPDVVDLSKLKSLRKSKGK